MTVSVAKEIVKIEVSWDLLKHVLSSHVKSDVYFEGWEETDQVCNLVIVSIFSGLGRGERDSEMTSVANSVRRWTDLELYDFLHRYVAPAARAIFFSAVGRLNWNHDTTIREEIDGYHNFHG